MSIVSVVVYVVCSEAGQPRTNKGQAVSVWTSVTVTVDVVMGTVVVGGSVCEVVIWVAPGLVAEVEVSVVASSTSVQSSSSSTGICVAPEPFSMVVEMVVLVTLDGGGLGVGMWDEAGIVGGPEGMTGREDEGEDLGLAGGDEIEEVEVLEDDTTGSGVGVGVGVGMMVYVDTTREVTVSTTVDTMVLSQGWYSGLYRYAA
jgi:hypothetical protein